MTTNTDDDMATIRSLSRLLAETDAQLVQVLSRSIDRGVSAADLVGALAPTGPAAPADPSHLGEVAIDARAVGQQLLDVAADVELDDALTAALALTAAVRAAVTALSQLLPRAGAAAIALGGSGAQLAQALGGN